MALNGTEFSSLCPGAGESGRHRGIVGAWLLPPTAGL
jgi:hypothetical protein